MMKIAVHTKRTQEFLGYLKVSDNMWERTSKHKDFRLAYNKLPKLFSLDDISCQHQILQFYHAVFELKCFILDWEIVKVWVVTNTEISELRYIREFQEGME